MKMFLISDNIDTCIGMRLAGVESEIAHTREEFAAAFEKVVEDENIGVVMVTNKLNDMADDIIKSYVRSHSMPLVTIIPDRHLARNEE